MFLASTFFLRIIISTGYCLWNMCKCYQHKSQSPIYKIYRRSRHGWNTYYLHERRRWQPQLSHLYCKGKVNSMGDSRIPYLPAGGQQPNCGNKDMSGLSVIFIIKQRYKWKWKRKTGTNRMKWAAGRPRNRTWMKLSPLLTFNVFSVFLDVERLVSYLT